MDITTLSVEKADIGTVMEVTHPVTGEPLTFTDENGQTRTSTITLLGITGNVAQQHMRKQQNRRFRKAAATGQTITAEDYEAAELSLLADLTVGWQGIERGTEAILCTPENARALYVEFPWLRTQVKAHIENTANYVGN